MRTAVTLQLTDGECRMKKLHPLLRMKLQVTQQSLQTYNEEEPWFSVKYQTSSETPDLLTKTKHITFKKTFMLPEIK